VVDFLPFWVLLRFASSYLGEFHDGEAKTWPEKRGENVVRTWLLMGSQEDFGQDCRSW